MRKLLPLLVAAASLSSAATIPCVPSNQNTITNAIISSPQVVDCGVVNATPGFVITELAIRFLGTFADAVQNTNHQLRFTATNDFNAASVTADTNIADFTGIAGPQTGTPVAVLNLASLGPVTLSVTTTVLGGFTTPDNASFTAFLETTEVSIVPEPSSLALLGSALVGLGWISRRRK